jgi:hypothetical protein
MWSSSSELAEIYRIKPIDNLIHRPSEFSFQSLEKRLSVLSTLSITGVPGVSFATKKSYQVCLLDYQGTKQIG